MKIKVTPIDHAQGELNLPGDKSISHRAALLGAIAKGDTRIKNFSTAKDVQSTLACLKKLGVGITYGKDHLVIHGKELRGFSEPEDSLDCGNSGTTMRLLCGILAGQSFMSVLQGDESLRKRPMDRVIQPLQQMGAQILARGQGFSPIAIRGGNLQAIDYTLPVASAQVKSALLLAGLYAQGVQIVREPIPTRDHTERMLRWMGIDLQQKDGKITLGDKRQPVGKTFTIPGDLSSAAYFMAIGCLVPSSEIKLINIGLNPLRTGFIQALQSMGARITPIPKGIESFEPVGDVVVRYSPLKGITLGNAMIPRVLDELPLLAVVATQAEGTTVVKDAQELRVKESDRIKAITQELQKLGATIIEREDGFVVQGPSKLHGGTCWSHGDHRIAMALVIAGLIAEGEVTIQESECMDISFPEFIPKVKKLIDNPFVIDTT